MYRDTRNVGHEMYNYTGNNWKQLNGNKSLTLRLLMSYIYGAPILDVSRSHTKTHHSR